MEKLKFGLKMPILQMNPQKRMDAMAEVINQLVEEVELLKAAVNQPQNGRRKKNANVPAED